MEIVFSKDFGNVCTVSWLGKQWAANSMSAVGCVAFRALSNRPNVYLKRNPVCYVKNNPLSVDLNGSEMSINKEIFKVALVVFPE